VCAVSYEMGLYIPEDGILHSENLRSYMLQYLFHYDNGACNSPLGRRSNEPALNNYDEYKVTD
jgi:hypothetical protein